MISALGNAKLQMMASAEELKVQYVSIRKGIIRYINPSAIPRLVSEEKYLKDRVEHVERHFAAIAANVGGAVRKMALLRDKGDKLVKAINDFASSENGTLKNGLEGLAECLTAIENCQQVKVKIAIKLMQNTLLRVYFTTYNVIDRSHRGESSETFVGIRRLM